MLSPCPRLPCDCAPLLRRIILDPSDTITFPAVLAGAREQDGGKTFGPIRWRACPSTTTPCGSILGSRALAVGNDGGVYLTATAPVVGASADPIGQFYTVIVDTRTRRTFCAAGCRTTAYGAASATRDRTGITDADWFPVNGGDGMWVRCRRTILDRLFGLQFGQFLAARPAHWKQDPIQPRRSTPARLGLRVTTGAGPRRC